MCAKREDTSLGRAPNVARPAAPTSKLAIAPAHAHACLLLLCGAETNGVCGA